MPASCQPLLRANVLGVGIDPVDMTAALDVIREAIATGRKGYVCATGVHGVMEAQRDPTLRTVFARAAMVVPDGAPMVWMGKLQGRQQMKRVFGPDLMLAVMGDHTLAHCSHFLYGGDLGVALELQACLRRRFPQVQISGTYAPPFRVLNYDEESHFLKLVDRLRPDIVWVGLGTPKQEHFMAHYLSRLTTTLMIGVGAAFDFHSGRLKDSPPWVKVMGLQWLHRLYQEPRRLWKRYLVNNPSFLVSTCLQLTGCRRYSLPREG